MDPAYLLLIILLSTLILFVWGILRYDVVAAMGLFAAVVFHVIPFNTAFSGFSNPAVLTVGFVMIITAAINRTGIIARWVGHLQQFLRGPVSYTAVLCFVTAVLSAFMNNVGALALTMPIAIESSAKLNRSPSLILIPLAIASVLGGMTTSIGTPPNIFIAEYRQELVGHPFLMFDYSFVGLPVALAGILFIIFIGWRFLPSRSKPGLNPDEMFQMSDYIAEAVVTEHSSAVGKTIKELETITEKDVVVIGLIRSGTKRLMTRANMVLEVGDILLIEASHHELADFMSQAKLDLTPENTKVDADLLRSDDTELFECVISPGSRMEGRTSQGLHLRSRYKVNVLAVSRGGESIKKRLHHVKFRAGDVVLFQGNAEGLQATLVRLGGLPLSKREVRVGKPKRAWLPIAIFVVALVATALSVAPVQITFAMTVLCYIVLNIMPVRVIYESVDWSIIVLLAMMIPLGQALEYTGGTQLIANTLLGLGGHFTPIILLAILMIITMTLSDLMNNAATAVLMAPIAIGLAHGLHANIDPFLMCVAIGASCSFLTPISHQNNMLVMGPGGYKFYDYLRLGLPIELIVISVALPIILHVWPMH